MRYFVCLAASLVVPSAHAFADEPKSAAEQVRAAVAKTLPLIQKGAAGHRANRTCFACHHQGLPILAMTTARSHGFDIDEKDLRQHLQFIADFLDKNRANYLKGSGQGGQAGTAGHALWTLELGGYPPNPTTDAVAEYLLLFNKDLDHWRATANRPPSEVSHFTTSYMALRALQSYGTKEQQERITERLKVVRAWLAKTPAKDTEDRVFRLWAMKRTGFDAKDVEAAAQELIKTQDKDGGWSQLASMKPDAYATGSALVALHDAGGLATNADVYRRGLDWLLANQLKDGSWHVPSRSKPFQTYFESGFPHGKDQFISLAASSWATTALALALPVASDKKVRP